MRSFHSLLLFVDVLGDGSIYPLNVYTAGSGIDFGCEP